MLHSLFWQNLSPDGGGKPKGELLDAIERDFGGFDAFKKQLTQAAATSMGSGWGALVWDPISSRLLTAQIHDHQGQALIGSVPLMVLDAWEHAYYLQYQNEKAKYFDAIWNVWNWDGHRRALCGSAEIILRAAVSHARRRHRQAPARSAPQQQPGTGLSRRASTPVSNASARGAGRDLRAHATRYLGTAVAEAWPLRRVAPRTRAFTWL